jgi:hypothetical protein
LSPFIPVRPITILTSNCAPITSLSCRMRLPRSPTSSHLADIEYDRTSHAQSPTPAPMCPSPSNRVNMPSCVSSLPTSCPDLQPVIPEAPGIERHRSACLSHVKSATDSLSCSSSPYLTYTSKKHPPYIPLDPRCAPKLPASNAATLLSPVVLQLRNVCFCSRAHLVVHQCIWDCCSRCSSM